MYLGKKEEKKTNIENYPELLVQEALKYQGYPAVLHGKRCRDVDYCIYGTLPETGFDCSGFVVHLLNTIEFPIPPDIRHCNEFLDRFGVFAHWRARKSGDLVLFSRNGTRPTHMGIMIDQQRYIHAPGKNNTVVSVAELKATTIPQRYREQLYFTNPIAFKRLALPNGRWQKIL